MKSKPSPSASERVVIHLRVDARQRALIDRAAAITGKTRSEFMVEAACREATHVLVDQSLVLLTEVEFQRFEDALDLPLQPNPRLARLLAAKAPWER